MAEGTGRTGLSCPDSILDAATLLGAAYYRWTELLSASLLFNVLFIVVLGFYLFLPQATAFFRGETVGGGP